MTASPAARLPTAVAPGPTISAVQMRPQGRRPRRSPLRQLGFERKRVSQQHRRAQNRPERIGDAATAMSGAERGWVHTSRRSCSRSKPMAAGRATDQHRCLVRENVAEHVLGQQHVKLVDGAAGAWRRIDQHVLDRTSGNSSAITRSTTVRQSRDVSSTLALSTETMCLRRPIASRPATRVTARSRRCCSCRRPRPRVPVRVLRPKLDAP